MRISLILIPQLNTNGINIIPSHGLDILLHRLPILAILSQGPYKPLNLSFGHFCPLHPQYLIWQTPPRQHVKNPGADLPHMGHSPPFKYIFYPTPDLFIGASRHCATKFQHVSAVGFRAFNKLFAFKERPRSLIILKVL